MVSIPSRAFSSLAVRARLPDRPTCTKSHQRPKTGESRQRFDATEGPSGVQSASLDISNESGLVTLPWHRSAPLWPVTAQCPHIHASCFAQISPCKHTVPHAVCIALDTTQTQREAHPQPQDVVFFPSQWWFPRSSKGCAASVQSNRTFEDIGGGKEHARLLSEATFATLETQSWPRSSEGQTSSHSWRPGVMRSAVQCSRQLRPSWSRMVCSSSSGSGRAKSVLCVLNGGPKHETPNCFQQTHSLFEFKGFGQGLHSTKISELPRLNTWHEVCQYMSN